MLKRNWVVLLVYLDHEDGNIKSKWFNSHSKTTKRKAISSAIDELCFKRPDGLGYRNLMLAKAFKENLL